MDKIYISKVVNGEDTLYIKDAEARLSMVTSVSYDTTNKKLVKTVNGTSSDVVSVSTIKNDLNLSKSDVNLSNVTNDAQVKRSEMGANNGVATLGSDGKVPSSQLPSYVDDVIEYDKTSDFPATGESGKIYISKEDNTTWRWSGTAYMQIKGDLIIGTATGNAADGKVVNDHINNTSNPHGVTKSQVGLGNVGNFKAVSTEANQGLSSTEKANARTNIGAGTSSFSGSYDDLSSKPSLGSAAAKDAPSSGNASNSQVVLGNDSRLTDARAANGGNADTIDNCHIAVVTEMPSSPNENTIYIVK